MSDYNFLMENRLTPPQFEALNHLSRFAHSEGLNLYLVGGAVRDLTCGHQVIRDLDFAVEGNPARILKHLPVRNRPGRAAATAPLAELERPPAEISDLTWNRRLNTVEIRFSSGARAELSQSRREIYSRPSKPPEILPSTIFDDLKRRDFAMNAMAVSLHPNSRGLLLDPTNGVGDIERREIRALHSRSFTEDPVRIYRALRLGARLGFKPDEKTRAWLDAATGNRLWNVLTPEQQGRELEAILQEDNPAAILKMLAEQRLLEGLDRKLKRIPYDRFHKLRPLLQKVPNTDPLPLNFHCLVSTLGTAQRARLARKIFRSPAPLKEALRLERDARKLARAVSSPKAAAPSQAYPLLAAQPRPLIIFLLAHYPQVKIQNRVRYFLFKAPVIRARVPRAELQSLGVPAGPKFDKILSQIFFDQLDGKIKNPQQLTKALCAAAGIKEAPKPVAPAREKKKTRNQAMPPHAEPPRQAPPLPRPHKKAKPPAKGKPRA